MPAERHHNQLVNLQRRIDQIKSHPVSHVIWSPHTTPEVPTHQDLRPHTALDQVCITVNTNPIFTSSSLISENGVYGDIYSVKLFGFQMLIFVSVRPPNSVPGYAPGYLPGLPPGIQAGHMPGMPGMPGVGYPRNVVPGMPGYEHLMRGAMGQPGGVHHGMPGAQPMAQPSKP